VYGSVKCDYSW